MGVRKRERKRIAKAIAAKVEGEASGGGWDYTEVEAKHLGKILAPLVLVEIARARLAAPLARGGRIHPDHPARIEGSIGFDGFIGDRFTKGLSLDRRPINSRTISGTISVEIPDPVYLEELQERMTAIPYSIPCPHPFALSGDTCWNCGTVLP